MAQVNVAIILGAAVLVAAIALVLVGTMALVICGGPLLVVSLAATATKLMHARIDVEATRARERQWSHRRDTRDHDRDHDRRRYIEGRYGQYIQH